MDAMTVIDALAIGGFKQYEVSNFALKGFESKHNENYWANGAYLGLGASASGEVEMTLLDRGTELVEEAGRLLERLGRVAG